MVYRLGLGYDPDKKRKRQNNFMYSLCYFMGLIIAAIAFGNYTQNAPYGFFVLSGGLILYPIMVMGVYPIIKKLIK